jgi:hypothetical protein
MSKPKALTVSNETAMQTARGKCDRDRRSLLEETGQMVADRIEALTKATGLPRPKKRGQ